MSTLKRQQKWFRQRLQRQKCWYLLTGLLPPEQRGFVPAVEGDERPAQLDPEVESQQREASRLARKLQQENPERPRRTQAEIQAEIDAAKDSPWRPVPHWGIPSRSPDVDPGFDNAVRALEDWLTTISEDESYGLDE